jgi:hypothetical protein
LLFDSGQQEVIARCNIVAAPLTGANRWWTAAMRPRGS